MRKAVSDQFACSVLAKLQPTDKIYLTALFHDNEHVLPFWTEQMNRLILFLGKVCTLFVADRH